jgi:type I restriction enzyme R subunit
VKDWRAQEIVTTKDIINSESMIEPLVSTHTNRLSTDDVNFAPKMVAENIIIPGSLEVRLKNTKREDLLAGALNLVLMYAISPVARKKTESAGKIALGIKEDNLASEAIKAYESVKYIMFHYWKNSEAKPFELTKSIRLVSKSEIPDEYLLRQKKDAKQYLLIEYDNMHPVNIGDFDILKVQRKGSDRYIPFVCKVDNIKVDNDD